MSIKRINIASGLADEKIGANNLDIYIPKINENHTEHDIKCVFANMGIGMVSHVDFVATKDSETKQIKFYSAFLKLTEWHPNGYWYNLLMVEKQNKIEISKFEFWIILPANTSISRSKVNTHQLAAYTDELYVKVEAVEKSVTINSTHFQNLLAKSEAQAAQINQLLKIVAEQSNQITQINNLIFQGEPEQKPRSLTIKNLEVLVPVQCDNNFDAQKEETKPEEKPIVYCEDECFFMKPLNITDTTTPKQKKADIQSGTFSFNLEDVLGPVSKSIGITKEETKRGFEKEWANTNRAKTSKNICGNA
jgi:hypothetical protein